MAQTTVRCLFPGCEHFHFHSNCDRCGLEPGFYEVPPPMGSLNASQPYQLGLKCWLELHDFLNRPSVGHNYVELMETRRSDTCSSSPS